MGRIDVGGNGEAVAILALYHIDHDRPRPGRHLIREPGWSSPNMEPGLGQWALTTAPSTSAMSERNLL